MTNLGQLDERTEVQCEIHDAMLLAARDFA